MTPFVNNFKFYNLLIKIQPCTLVIPIVRCKLIVPVHRLVLSNHHSLNLALPHESIRNFVAYYICSIFHKNLGIRTELFKKILLCVSPCIEDQDGLLRFVKFLNQLM